MKINDDQLELSYKNAPIVTTVVESIGAFL